MRRSGSRVLAGVVSLAVGGVFVAASAMGAFADSPAPSGMNPPVVAGSTVTLSGTLNWGGACKAGAGFGIVWNDTGDVGQPVPGDASQLVGLRGVPSGESDGNLVHAAACAGGGITFGPVAHTYVGPLPAQVCVIGYHFNSSQTNSPFHSKWEGNAAGQPGNTDNSILEPVKGGQQEVCAAVVKKQPDVTITNAGTPGSLTPGDQITYHIVVSNLAAANGATTQTQLLTDTLDPDTSFVSVTGGANWTNCSGSGHTVTCSYTPVLNPGAATSEVTVVAKVDNSITKNNVVNVAHVDDGAGNPDDANVNNQTASVTTPVTIPPQNIGIDKTATPKVNVGDPITYTMTVTNTSGTATKDPISVTDALPSKVQFVSATGTNWNCSGGQNLTCTWQGGSLAPHQSTTAITVIATALDSAVPSVTNTAHAHMGNIDVQDSATTIVNTPVNLTLHKSASPASGSDVSLGDQIDYTLHYSNTGTTDADGATITDDVPIGTTLVSGSIGCSPQCTSIGATDTSIQWNLDIPAGGSGSVMFSVTVDNDDVDGQIIDNVGEINFNGSHTPSNHTRHRVFIPTGKLTLHKTVTPTTATVGTVLTYTLTAQASGDIDQTAVVVTDAIPDATTYKDGSASCESPCTASFDSSSNVVTWDVGTMHPGDAAQMVFAVTVNPAAADGTLPTEIVNVGAIHSDQTPPKPSNRVVVPLTVVLGEKVVRTPPTTTLPFTGFDAMQNALIALVLIGGGLVLITWPRLRRQPELPA
jgi:uncharacterized repeat protein (TIGR01451 family)